MFWFHGGLLWVDFINTEYWHGGERHDALDGLDRFLAWAKEAGLDADVLLEAERKAEVWRELRALRAELCRFAKQVAESGVIPAAFVASLNERCAKLPGTWRVEQQDDNYRAVFVPQGDILAQLQWPLLHSVLTFIAEGQTTRLKGCSNHECIQYYYDTSKNNARRWCRMDTCGNREKARRHYRRKTGGSQDE